MSGQQLVPPEEGRDEFWVCTCFTYESDDYGALYVPGGADGPVLCPWCGDHMSSDWRDFLSEDERDRVYSLKPDGEVASHSSD